MRFFKAVFGNKVDSDEILSKATEICGHRVSGDVLLALVIYGLILRIEALEARLNHKKLKGYEFEETRG